MEDFKVGDLVEVKNLREFNHYEFPFIVTEMYSYINTIQTISKILLHGDNIICFLKDNIYQWNTLWLSPLKFDKEMWK